MVRKKRYNYTPGHQLGKSKRSVDARIRARKPGKRKSSAGKRYYENRRNRSDKNPKKRL